MAAPAIAVKPVRFEYQSFNSKSGLTDVKGQIYVNGVAKAVGANALGFTELDATNSKGDYTLLISAAQLSSWGVAAGAENTVVCYANSASWPGPAPIKMVAQVATADDIIAYLGSPATTSIAGDILQLYNRVGAPAAASVSADILNLANQQATILSQVQALANATDTGGAGVVALQGIIPKTGTFPLNVPVTVTDNTGASIAPTSITVTMQNASGTDRGSYITGATSTGGAAYTYTPTASSTGVYSVPVVIPAGAPEEQLVMKIVYVYKGITRTQFAVIQVVTDYAAEGFSTQTSVDAIATNVSSVLSAIQSTTFGLNALLGQIQTAASNASTAATNAQNAYTAAQQAVTGINSANTEIGKIEGSGFATASHSLVAISAAIAAIPTSGGRGV